ncbi:MAG: winged helix-turn-helix domain-containing protein [Clostridium sulfidigenes]|uniref:Winged helix-turn-helix domain-containing protein n=1 Tax=Clostridium sulfidigenes TaxID=318464 RepID=A0A927W926_9CLOT|nr:winged helix-turn-helix domain-containing protein [Clostridium sulfidigenes]
MKKITMSKGELRKFLVMYQGLSSPKSFNGEEGIKSFINRVGCIQYDPLNMVGRNADLVLQSRVENYNPMMLETLLYNKRELIDGWDKMMAIYSVNDWPYFARVRLRRKEEIERVLHHRNSIEAINYVGVAKEYIEKNGATLPSKLDLGRVESGVWGHGKLSSATMDYMWNSGTLGIKEKKNTQKIYDLIEKLLPKEILEMKDPFNSDDDFYKWYFKRRIGSIGIYWERNGEGWLGHFVSDKNLRKKILKELLEDGELILVKVEGLNETFYIRADDTSMLDNLNSSIDKKASFLAPLDNLLWDRKLVKDIFDFEYSWEVYKPVSKRQYGYYVLPVLYGDKLVARFEPEIHRGNEPLIIKNWWWEENYQVTEEVIVAMMGCFERFCKYLKADGLEESSWRKIKG